MNKHLSKISIYRIKYWYVSNAFSKTPHKNTLILTMFIDVLVESAFAKLHVSNIYINVLWMLNRLF